MTGMAMVPEPFEGRQLDSSEGTLGVSPARPAACGRSATEAIKAVPARTGAYTLCRGPS